MDAWLIPYDREIPVEGLAVPFLFMESENWQSRRNQPLAEALFANMDAEAYRVTIGGTSHYDFADFPLISPAAHLMGFKGPLPTQRVMRIIRAYSVAFFDSVFKGEDALTRLQLYPEAILEVKP
jgi:hypothetical protein